MVFHNFTQLSFVQKSGTKCTNKIHMQSTGRGVTVGDIKRETPIDESVHIYHTQTCTCTNTHTFTHDRCQSSLPDICVLESLMERSISETCAYAD